MLDDCSVVPARADSAVGESRLSRIRRSGPLVRSRLIARPINRLIRRRCGLPRNAQRLAGCRVGPCRRGWLPWRRLLHLGRAAAVLAGRRVCTSLRANGCPGCAARACCCFAKGTGGGGGVFLATTSRFATAAGGAAT